MSVTIGVIAEQQNDIDILYEFTCKLTLEKSFTFRGFRAHGCGKLRRKCNSWAHNLLTRGCSLLVIIHDLDDFDENCLRKDLEGHVSGISFVDRVILIPIYEIEAWLLSDSLALRQTFNMGKLPKVPKHPERIRNPKEYLRDIVWKYCKKHYVNTIHNQKIARAINIERLYVCPSFSPYPAFVSKHFNQ